MLWVTMRLIEFFGYRQGQEDWLSLRVAAREAVFTRKKSDLGLR